MDDEPAEVAQSTGRSGPMMSSSSDGDAATLARPSERIHWVTPAMRRNGIVDGATDSSPPRRAEERRSVTDDYHPEVLDLRADPRNAAESLGWLLLEGEELCRNLAQRAAELEDPAYEAFFSSFGDSLANLNGLVGDGVPATRDGVAYPPWRPPGPAGGGIRKTAHRG